MSEEERLNSLIMQLRVLESYLNEIREREALASRALFDSKAALDALNGLPKDGTNEVIFPIGGGLFISSDTSPPESILVAIGANVVVEKTRADAITFVEERIKEIERALTSLVAQRNALVNKINGARTEAGNLVSKLQGEQQGA